MLIEFGAGALFGCANSTGEYIDHNDGPASFTVSLRVVCAAVMFWLDMGALACLV